MNHIDGFFGKLKNAFSQIESKKEIIVSVCFEHTGAIIQTTQVEIQGQFIKLNINPSARSAIFMKKTEILKDLSEKIKPKPLDIR